MVAPSAGRHAAPRSAARRASVTRGRHAAPRRPGPKALSVAAGALAGAALAAGGLTVLGQTNAVPSREPVAGAAADLAGQRPTVADGAALEERRTTQATATAPDTPAMRVERRLLLRRLEGRDRRASRSAPRDGHATGRGAGGAVQRAASRAASRADTRPARSDQAGRRREAGGAPAGRPTSRVRRSAAEDAARKARNAWRLPVSVGAYHLTARFGECSSLWASCHTGLDFAASSGTPVRNVADGQVAETGWAGAYGERTVVTLADGTEIWFCHQSSIQVAPGQRVSAGQVIGTVGSTGNTTGPHLHLEVRPGGGDPVDPYAALLGHGAHP